MDNILEQTLAATTICKVLVDMFRLAQPTPGRFAPALAIVFGVSACLFLVLAADETLTVAAAARSVLAGVLAAGSAVGVTALQTRVQREPAPPA